MTMPNHATFLFAAMLVVGGCASYDGRGLRAGVSSESDVRGIMGAPAAEFTADDGSRRLIYPRGPLGTRTYVAEVGADHALRSVRQVLNDDTFHHIQPGQTRDDVLRLIGPPGDTMAYPLSGNYSWDYRYTDTWGYLAIFSVTFDRNGMVVSKISQRIERDRGGP
jgi:hypothetical protein